MSSAELVSWFSRLNLLKLLYGPTGFHPAVAQQSTKILCFMANKMLNSDDIKFLWNVTLNMHTADQDVMIEVLMTLILALPSKLLQVIQDLLSEIKPDDIDARLLRLVKASVNASVILCSSKETSPPPLMDYLYAVGNSTSSVAVIAQEYLIQFLSYFKCAIFRYFICFS